MERTDPVNMVVSDVGDKVLGQLVERKYFATISEAAKFLVLYSLENHLDSGTDLVEYKVVNTRNKWDSAAFADVRDILLLLRDEQDLPYTRIRSLIDIGARDVEKRMKEPDFRISDLL